VRRRDGGRGWRDDRIAGNRHEKDEATTARDDRVSHDWETLSKRQALAANCRFHGATGMRSGGLVLYSLIVVVVNFLVIFNHSYY
jgi:hypothetical protein